MRTSLQAACIGGFVALLAILGLDVGSAREERARSRRQLCKLPPPQRRLRPRHSRPLTWLRQKRIRTARPPMSPVPGVTAIHWAANGSHTTRASSIAVTFKRGAASAT
jgi:hypothetical protein